MRFGLDRYHCINLCKSFLIYRTICNAFKFTMSTCNWKKSTLRHWLRPTERCLHTAKSEREHLHASIKSEYRLIQVRTFHARWSYDQYIQVYRWLHGSCGHFICLLYGVMSWVIFSAINRVSHVEQEHDYPSGVHPRFMVGFVLLDL